MVDDHIQDFMPEVNKILDDLAPSQKNLQYFAERVDYYGAKLRRQRAGRQQLYLLCYLHSRWQLALEHIADGFIHHIRQTQQKVKTFAQEAVYQDWQKARNVSKAAAVLHLFVDESIDPQQPFERVRKQAMRLLPKSDLESVCLFLNDQKRSVAEAVWQYYDQREYLRKGLLRSHCSSVCNLKAARRHNDWLRLRLWRRRGVNSQRKTTQALLVRKLSDCKRNHPLLEALTEYNRLLKANYLLNYIDVFFTTAQSHSALLLLSELQALSARVS